MLCIWYWNHSLRWLLTIYRFWLSSIIFWCELTVLLMNKCPHLETARCMIVTKILIGDGLVQVQRDLFCLSLLDFQCPWLNWPNFKKAMFACPIYCLAVILSRVIRHNYLSLHVYHKLCIQELGGVSDIADHVSKCNKSVSSLEFAACLQWSSGNGWPKLGNLHWNLNSSFTTQPRFDSHCNPKVLK